MIEHASDLAAAITASRPGSTVVLGIWRHGRLDEIPVRVALLFSPTLALQRTSGAGPESSFVLLSVQQLSLKQRRAIGTDGHLLVIAVSEQAAAAGVEIGDIVLGVGAIELKTASELRQALAQGSHVLALLIERDGARIYVALPPQILAARAHSLDRAGRSLIRDTLACRGRHAQRAERRCCAGRANL
jgi:serine protease Do